MTQNANVYTLTGTQLNGLNEGAYYGDDHQQATNYPIIQLVDKAGNIVDATSFDWSTASVATGSTPESVEFAASNDAQHLDAACRQRLRLATSYRQRHLELSDRSDDHVRHKYDRGECHLRVIRQMPDSLTLSTRRRT